jgi:hypothetical protein
LVFGLTARQFLTILIGVPWRTAPGMNQPHRPACIFHSRAACLALTCVLALVRPGDRPIQEWAVVALPTLRAKSYELESTGAGAVPLARSSGRGLGESGARPGLGGRMLSIKPFRGSVQAIRIGLDTISGGVVRLKAGQYRAVLEVAGIASPLERD